MLPGDAIAVGAPDLRARRVAAGDEARALEQQAAGRLVELGMPARRGDLASGRPARRVIGQAKAGGALMPLPHRVGGIIVVRHPSAGIARRSPRIQPLDRSEEHTSELQSLMRISSAVFCLKKKNQKTTMK